MEVVGCEGGREEGGGAPGEGDICSPCIFHKGEIERWERAWKGERERQTGRQVPAPGWDEEQRLQKKRDRRHSLPSGTAFPVAPTGVRPPQPQCECMCELGCASVLCRRTRVSPCTQPRDARVCGCVGGVGEHRWVPGPRRASPRQDPPAATTTIPQVLPVSCCKIHL